MSGRVQLFHDGIIRGPYTKQAREYWLRKVLETQNNVRELGPDEFKNLELITLPQLHEIRRIWLYEKHEFDDTLPSIYEDILDEQFPSPPSDDNLLRGEDWEILRDICGDEPELFNLQTSLLDIERGFRGMSRRAGIFEALEEQLRIHQFTDEDEAVAIHQQRSAKKDSALGYTETQSV